MFIENLCRVKEPSMTGGREGRGYWIEDVDDKNKGEVLGVDIGKNTIESLANQIKQNTDPMAYPSIRIEESIRSRL